ncbi:MAG: amino acid permease [Hyphomonadaceae bacterium]|nr:amino acid permease [Hyphomonadaceae bacterium]
MSDVSDKPLGFWSCWSLTVGCMIGSGIFMLPTLLAPYGLLSFGGWIIAGGGSIALALVFGRLAARTRCNGGPYAYSREAFGDLTGFLMAWAYWISFLLGVPVVAIAFVGYLGVFIPALNGNAVAQALSALGLISIFTFINIRGLKEMSAAQITLTILKIVPLLAIIGVAFVAGEPANLPAFNPSGQPVFAALAAVALIALWPFTGFEVVTLPATNVKDCERTIPRALFVGMITVVIIYLSATAAVMLLVPSHQLAQSTAPFADAARALGAWGPNFIAAGALVATAGTLNGLIFTCGQMPMAVAIDKLAPSWLAVTNKSGVPQNALILSAALSAILLVANYSRGLIGAFTFMLMMATALGLIYYVVVSVAELRHSSRSALGWAAIAIIGIVYSLFAAFGSGLEVLFWGVAAMLTGVPLYYLFRPRPGVTAASSPPS